MYMEIKSYKVDYFWILSLEQTPARGFPAWTCTPYPVWLWNLSLIEGFNKAEIFDFRGRCIPSPLAPSLRSALAEEGGVAPQFS